MSPRRDKGGAAIGDALALVASGAGAAPARIGADAESEPIHYLQTGAADNRVHLQSPFLT